MDINTRRGVVMPVVRDLRTWGLLKKAVDSLDPSFKQSKNNNMGPAIILYQFGERLINKKITKNDQCIKRLQRAMSLGEGNNIRTLRTEVISLSKEILHLKKIYHCSK